MINKSFLQKFSSITIILLILTLVPVSTVSAAWDGVFTLSSATYSVDEDGGTVSITIMLTGSYTPPKPTIKYSTSDETATAGSDYTAIPLTTKKFNKAGSWTFRIPITNDTLVEGNETFAVTLSDPQNGPSLGSPSTAVVTIIDNDFSGIIVTPSSGLSVTEAGGTSQFIMQLNSQPSASVIIILSSSDTSEGTVSPTSLTFTTTDWNTPQTVTITGEDDAYADGNQDFSIITDAAASTDFNYNGINASDVSVTNIDNDLAGITIIPNSGLSVTETGGTASFIVVLNTQPVGDVTISLSSSDTTEGTVSPALLTFSTGNWNTPQTVTNTGVNDFLDDGDINFTVVTDPATSADLSYSGLDASDVSVTNIDDDTARIIVNPINGIIVTEDGGTGTFTVVLASQPTADVSIGLSSSDLSEGTVSSDSLIFTPDDWSTPQIVTITGVDDFHADGNVDFEITSTDASSSDPSYSGMIVNDVMVTNNDNDTPGITAAPNSGLIVTEAGGTDTFSVVLNSQPTSDVILTLTSSDLSEGTVSPTSLIFTSSNWYTSQTVTVTGVEDYEIDDNIDFIIVIVVEGSADPNYSIMDAIDVWVTNLDNDAAGITIIPTSGLVVTEAGGTATFSVVLKTLPTADVSFGLSSSDLSEGTVFPDSLTFTSGNGNIPQIVTVTGVDDFVDDGDVSFNVVTDTVSSADGDYDGLETDEVTVTNQDDDTAWIIVIPTSGLTVTEAGGIAISTIILNTQPIADVSIELSSSDLSEGTVSLSPLIFTPIDWNIPQTVTVTGMDDTDVDGNIDFMVDTAPANSTDPGYSNLDASNITVTNMDDDVLPPIANPDSYFTLFKHPLAVDASAGVLSNDFDPNGLPLYASLLFGPPPEHGTLVFNSDGSFTFTPTDTFSGDVTFQYQAFDGLVYSSPVTVVIQVIAKQIFLPMILRPSS